MWYRHGNYFAIQKFLNRFFFVGKICKFSENKNSSLNVCIKNAFTHPIVFPYQHITIPHYLWNEESSPFTRNHITFSPLLSPSHTHIHSAKKAHRACFNQPLINGSILINNFFVFCCWILHILYSHISEYNVGIAIEERKITGTIPHPNGASMNNLIWARK